MKQFKVGDRVRIVRLTETGLGVSLEMARMLREVAIQEIISIEHFMGRPIARCIPCKSSNNGRAYPGGSWVYLYDWIEHASGTKFKARIAKRFSRL